MLTAKHLLQGSCTEFTLNSERTPLVSWEASKQEKPLRYLFEHTNCWVTLG
jgi:hypothetical protein